MILGDPGFGKSWLLRYEARRLALAALRALDEDPSNLAGLTLPILARLSDLNRSDDALEQALASLASTGRSGAFRQFVLERLKTANAVVLLDAWDEVPVEVPALGHSVAFLAHHRQRLGQRVEGFATSFECRLLLTSRIVGYDGSPIPGAFELELFAFDAPQIEAFARAWFKDGKPFLALLERNPQVQGLARVPLMLTLICRLFAEQPRLAATQEARPARFTRRVDIYEQCLRGLVLDWMRDDKRHSAQSAAQVDALLEVLAPVAYVLFAEGREQFNERLLRSKVRDELAKLKPDHELHGLDATTLINELKLTGILVTSGEDPDAPLLFLHRTFHEYLASLALAWRVRAEGWAAIADLLDHKAWRPAWREVVVLLAGQLADPKPLLALLADQRRDDLFRHRLALALLCLSELPDRFRNLPQVSVIAIEAVDVMVRHRAEDLSYTLGPLLDSFSAVGQADRLPAGALAKILEMTLEADDSLRSEAALLLGRLGPASLPALDRLVEMTYDGERNVRESAARALGGLGSAALPALDRLVEMTYDGERNVRESAARALGGLGSAALPALDRLVELTHGGDRIVEYAAVHVLADLAGSSTPAIDRLVNIINHHEKRRSDAVFFLCHGAAASPAFDRLVELTHDERLYVREAAVSALVHFGMRASPALDRLVELTHGEDGTVRTLATMALTGLGPAALPALDRLVELTRDEDVSVRTLATEALKGLGPGALPALDRLVEITHDENVTVRRLAAEALRGLGSASLPALNRLMEMTDDEDGTIRRLAAEALRGLGLAGLPALDTLVEMIGRSDQGREARRAAKRALSDPNTPKSEFLEWWLRSLGFDDEGMRARRAAADALRDLGAAALPALDRLVEMIRDRDEDARSFASDVLRGLGPAALPALDRLVEMTHDEDELMRHAASWALGGLGAGALPALDSIAGLCEDPAWFVRRAAADALAGLGAAALPALDRLVKLTYDEEGNVRAAAAQALGRLGGSASPVLKRLLVITRDQEWEVRIAAVEALGSLGTIALPASTGSWR